MDVDLKPGKYVVAVSGGVDSVVLLHLLAQKAMRYEPRDMSQEHPGSPLKSYDSRLVVVHLDHGIRPDSKNDREFVQQLARQYGLPFVYDTAQLGPGASEEAARTARYAFLHHVRRATGAQGIVTGHHQDDLLETAIINLVRGTGRRGLTSLQSTDNLIRPLLHLPKSQLVSYAKEHQLPWREDSSNRDTKYLRNHLRHNILPQLGDADRGKLLDIIHRLQELNRQIDHEITNHLHMQPAPNILDRHWFVMLPHAVAREVMAHWLRRAGANSYDRKTLERLVIAAKTFRPGHRTDINRQWRLLVNDQSLALVTIER